MTSSKKKFYVVWQGRSPGVYDTWAECSAMVKGVEGASYKGFPDLPSALQAFRDGSVATLTEKTSVSPKSAFRSEKSPTYPCLTVDAACSGNPGRMEYQGVDGLSRRRIFHQGPFSQGTNNIGEFLALVHALAYLKKHGVSMPVYSDSITALAWLRDKRAKTKLEPSRMNEELFEMIERAERWLHNNPGSYDVRKWETEAWGEIPADFGRKK
jgi:ribonuclease HI